MENISNNKSTLSLIKTLLNVYSSKGFFRYESLQEKDGVISAKVVTPKTIFSLLVSSNNNLVIEDKDEVLILKNLEQSAMIRALAEKVSFGSSEVDKTICESFDIIKFPKVIKNAIIYPVCISDKGVVYQDFNGKQYIHQDESNKVSLLFYKELYDRNREAEFLVMPDLFPITSSAYTKITSSVEDISDEALLKMNIEQKYGIPSLNQSLDCQLPLKIEKDELVRIKSSFAYFKESGEVAREGEDFRKIFFEKNAVWSAISDFKLSQALFNYIQNKSTSVEFPNINDIVSIKSSYIKSKDGQYELLVNIDTNYKGLPYNNMSYVYSAVIDKNKMVKLLESVRDEDTYSDKMIVSFYADDSNFKSYYNRMKVTDLKPVSSGLIIQSQRVKTLSFLKSFLVVEVKDVQNEKDFICDVYTPYGKEEMGLKEVISTFNLPPEVSKFNVIKYIGF